MRRLRVGVPAALAALPATTSVGRIWGNALAQLAERVDVQLVERPGRRSSRRRQRVDVWMSDGHQGPLEVRQPVVALFLEATWGDPELRPLFEPAFLAAYEGPSAAAAAAASGLVTISEAAKAQVVHAYGVDPARVEVAWPGVDHRTYRPGLAAPGPLLAAAGGDPARPYVLFVSVVHPRKNLAALRSAMAGVAARGLPHALVLVAAPAADRADSAALSAAAVAPIPGVAAPVVNLAGASDADLARLMAGAACFCLPSLMEGFAMPVAEAMACGAPVVVSDRGALPEVVGDAGLVVAPTGPAVEAALLEVLSDPAQAAQLSERGRVRAARYRWDSMAEGWLRALEQAADR